MDQDAKVNIDAQVSGGSVEWANRNSYDPMSNPSFARYAAGQGTGFDAPATSQFTGDRYTGSPFIPDPAMQPGSSPASIPSPPPAPMGVQGPSIPNMPWWFDTSSDMSPYSQAKAAAETRIGSARDAFALQGRFGDIGRAEFTTLVQDDLVSKGLASPPPAPGAYDTLRAKEQSVWESLRNQFAEQGSYGDINGPEFKSVGRQLLVGMGLANPEFNDPGEPIGAYKAAQIQKQIITDQINDEYAEGGKVNQIGGKAYRKDLLNNLVDAGIAEHETLGERWTHEMRGMGGAMGVGFAAMAASSGVSQYISQTQAGQYVSPEMIGASETNAAAQGIGSLGGTMIGALLGPEGALAGQFAGQGVGQIVGASATAAGERNTAERETAERLASVLGNAADSVEKFRAAIEATGAPVQQLGQGIQTIMGVAPGVTSASVVGAGGVANALGNFYTEDTSNIAKLVSSDPALYGAASQFAATGGALSAQDYNSLGDLALANGDMAGWQSARRDAARAGLVSNSRYQSAANEVNNATASDKVRQFFSDHPVLSALTGPLGLVGTPNQLGDAQNTVNGMNAQADSSAADMMKRDTETFLTLGRSRLDLAESQNAFALTGSQFALRQAQGAGARDLSGMLPAFQSAANQGISGDEAQIAQAQQRINAADPNTIVGQSVIAANQDIVIKRQQDEAQRRLTVAQVQRETFLMGIGEEESGYNLGIQQATQGGQSAAQMRAAAMGQVSYLRNVASDTQGNPLDPTQRTQLQAEAANIAFQNAQQQYGQEEGGLAIGRAGTGVQLATAQTSGGPSQVYQARSQQIQDTIALEQQLQAEIDKGNLTYDQRQQKLAQIKDLTADVLRQTQAQREEFYDSTLNIEGGNLAGTAALDSRNIARGGNAAFDPALLTQARGRMATAQAALANAKTPEEQAKYFQEYGAAYETEQGLIDQQNTFRPGATEEVRDINSRGAYQRSMELPYVAGPQSDPFRRGLDLIGNDERLLRGLNANRSRLLASGQWRPEDEVTYAQQSNSYQNDIAGLEHDQLFSLERMLPSMLAGGLTGGAQVAVTPTAAMASRFLGMNSPLLGGWGASGSAVGAIPTMGGGPAANFTAATGGLGGDHTYDMVALLREIRDNTSRHAPGPPMPAGNILNQELSQTPSPITRR